MHDSHLISKRSAIAVAAFFALVLLTVPSAATAGESPLDGVLDGLSWGASPQTVCQHLEDEIMAEAKQEIAKVSDPETQDRIRRQAEAEVKRLRQSYRSLKSRKQFGASIIRDEFLEGNDEALLRERTETGTNYWFFLDGQLYKVAVAYDPEYIGDIDFAGFLGAVASKYGKDFEQNFDEEGYLETAVWQEGDTRLRVEDETPIFDTFLMVFANVKRADQVAEAHAAARAERYAEAEVSDALAESSEGTDVDPGGRAADLIVGKIDINLREGLPEGEEAVAENDEDIEVSDEQTSDKANTAEKARKEGRRVKREKGESKIDPDEFERQDTEDGPIIIY